MKQLLALGLIWLTCTQAIAEVCPQKAINPPPMPWVLNPLSDIPSDLSAFSWKKTTVLKYNAGVTCTYYNMQQEEFSIWLPIPATPTDKNHWLKCPGGQYCTKNLQFCEFEIFPRL